MNRTIATLLVGLACSAATAPAALAEPPQGNYGTIKGRLVWKGDKIPQLPLLVKEGDPSVKDSATCAAGPLADRSLVVDPKSKGIRYAFAYLPRPTGKNADLEASIAAEEPTVVIDQQNCEFVPYARPFYQAQKVVFKSSDPVIHNVRYTGFNNPAVNLTLPPNGEYAAKLVAERRPIPLKCDVHPWMSGWLMVFDHPFYAVTDAEGNFEIKGVPAGEQNLVLWHEKVGYVTTGGARGFPVQVKAGAVTTIPPIELDPSKVKGIAGSE